jgi:hypothetical protein
MLFGRALSLGGAFDRKIILFCALFYFFFFQGASVF